MNLLGSLLLLRWKQSGYIKNIWLISLCFFLLCELFVDIISWVLSEVFFILFFFFLQIVFFLNFFFFFLKKGKNIVFSNKFKKILFLKCLVVFGIYEKLQFLKRLDKQKWMTTKLDVKNFVLPPRNYWISSFGNIMRQNKKNKFSIFWRLTHN